MKSNKSRIIIGGIVVLLIIGALLSVFSLFVYQMNDLFGDLEGMLEQSDTLPETDGGDSFEDPLPDTEQNEPSDSGGADENVDTFTVENGRLTGFLKPVQYNDGSGPIDAYVIGFATKEAPKSNTTYRIKWNLDDSVKIYFNCDIYKNVYDGVVRPSIFKCWSIDGNGWYQPEGTVGNESNVYNIDYKFNTGAESYDYIAFCPLTLFTEDYDTAVSWAKEIMKGDYFTNVSFTEEVTS